MKVYHPLFIVVKIGVKLRKEFEKLKQILNQGRLLNRGRAINEDIPPFTILYNNNELR